MANTLLDDEVERLLAEAEERLSAAKAPAKAVITLAQETAVLPSAAVKEIRASADKSETSSLRKDVTVRTPQLNAKRGKVREVIIYFFFFHKQSRSIMMKLFSQNITDAARYPVMGDAPAPS